LSRKLVLIATVALVGLGGGYLAYTRWGASPSGGPTVLYFHSDTCPYCKELTPVVDRLQHKYRHRVDFIYVNVSQDEGQRLGREHGVIGTPTLLLLDSEGERMNLIRGSPPESVLEQAVSDLVGQ
jgi:thiol-disulfide isomerase/thioredoxin